LLTDPSGALIVTHVSIFGTGNMGQAIARIVTAGGNSVEAFNRASADIAVRGEVVVLAVPYPALAEIVKRHGHQFAGRIVVDISNPLNFETFDSLVVPADGSSAAELAAALPGSRVLKAFNTNFAATLATGTVGGSVPTTVLVAGDDADAKAELIGLVAAGGLRGLDAGGLARARELEALGFLQLTLAVNEQVAWTGGLAVA
jgi:predicted dinucleotide-binding enzyme